MNIFLTSNIGGIKKENGIKSVIRLFENNNFLINLKDKLKSNKKFVLIASNPNEFEKNQYYLELDKKALEISGIKFEEYLVLDNSSIGDIESILSNSSLIFLSGGDTYLQNIFFNNINLKYYLNNIDACIVGISAGSINSAENVFNSPEIEEDLKNPSVLNGLGLTNINIEPHFDVNNNNSIQMNSIIKESYNRIIYGVPDGSYIFNNKIYGKCYKIENGSIKLISNDGEALEISKIGDG